MALDSKQICLLVLLVVSVLSILAALVLSVVNVSDLSLPPRTKYGMVFDAGSSHTSLYIYQWRADKENNTGIVAQALVCNVEGPGISSYANNPPEAGKSLINCLKQAMGYISQESQKETPVFLGATAGMRLLRDRNKNTSDQVLDEVSKAIRKYSVDFRGAEIISGEQEGSCGWISINYRLESLIKWAAKPPLSRGEAKCRPKFRERSYSSLDVIRCLPMLNETSLILVDQIWKESRDPICNNFV
ncbi:ectonucleoside triphosphate diphosphohydrolase 8-like [Discoglossus pictus]